MKILGDNLCNLLTGHLVLDLAYLIILFVVSDINLHSFRCIILFVTTWCSI